MRGKHNINGGHTLSSEEVKPESNSTIIEPTVSIIVPARNEADNLEIILPRLPKVHEVILVDGNSTDGSIERARAVLPEVIVVQQTRRGKGNALACGFERATGDIIVMFDADGSADPDEVMLFVEALKRGADFAKGSRFAKGGGSADITLLRKTGNWGLNLVYNIMFGTKYSDLCYGYNAFWSRLLPQLALPHSSIEAHPSGRMHWGDGFEIEAVINSRVAVNKFKIAEVASYEHARIHGTSNLNTWRDGWRVLNALVKEKRGSVLFTTTTLPLPQDAIILETENLTEVFVPVPAATINLVENPVESTAADA